MPSGEELQINNFVQDFLKFFSVSLTLGERNENHFIKPFTTEFAQSEEVSIACMVFLHVFFCGNLRFCSSLCRFSSVTVHILLPKRSRANWRNVIPVFLLQPFLQIPQTGKLQTMEKYKRHKSRRGEV